MEELEVSSWLTLDALKKSADIVETVGNLQTDHSLSVFCMIEDDHFELLYSDSASNAIRLYDDRDDFNAALEERKEESGETPFDEEDELNTDDDDEDEEDEEEEEEEEEGGEEGEQEDGRDED